MREQLGGSVGHKALPAGAVRVHDGEMQRDGDERPVEVARGDVMGFGTPEDEQRSGRHRWVKWVLVGLVAGSFAFVVANRDKGSSNPPVQTPTASASALVEQPTSTPTAPIIVNAGHPLLGITAGWQLFARSDADNSSIQIDFAHGRVTETTIPVLDSSGPVSYLVGPDWAIVRPLDNVPADLVPDGKPAHQLSWPEINGGYTVPGPDPSHLWVEDDRGSQVKMDLVDVNGKMSAPSITFPGEVQGGIDSDYAGYVLVSIVDGIYDARPGKLTLVTKGDLIAAGPTQWFVHECDANRACSNVVINRTTGARKVLSSFDFSPIGIVGAISPDGKTAGVFAADQSGALPSLHLVDLSTGVDRPVVASVEPSDPNESLVWSPDGKWLFVADQNGELKVIDPKDASVHGIGVQLPLIAQIALRR